MEVTGVRFETENLGAALAGIGQFNSAVDGIGTGIGRAATSFSASEQIIVGGLRRIGESAVLGVGALISKIGEGVSAGFAFNNSLEQTTAQLNAFTKDGAVSADILEMIRERAANTPFAFDEMARATAGLIPAAKQADTELESVVETAEILAASNPSEGLEGAAFALREAVSGDFTSVIERFNLPRQYINELKEQGVPALEIVRRAMAELGYDTDLVSNLAQTAQGRWSTLVDTFTTVASTVTQPVFDIFSESLGKLQAKLDENMPRILDIAGAIGEKLGNAVLWVADTAIPAMIDAWNAFGPAIMDGLSILANFATDAYTYGVGLAAAFADGIASAVSFVADALGAVGDTISYWLQPNSPPKIVPDLDRWGADAINVYLEGWTQGDFAIFEEIGSLISSQLRSIAEQAGSSIPKNGLIPMILGTRSAVAEAISQLQETGEIGEEAYQKIRDAAGPAGETIAGMLELLVEQVDATNAVSEAQDAYNAVVEEFTAKLDDLKAQRDAINEAYENTPVDQAIAANEEQQRAIRDAEKRAKLEKTIADKSKSEAERRKAQLELERMALEQQRRAEEKAREEALAGVDAQIDATEQERDVAVTAAQTKLDEAKAAKEAIDAEVAARQSVISTQQETNDLVAEHIRLLEQEAKAAAQAAKASGGGKAGGAKKPGAGRAGGGARIPKPKAPTAPIIGTPQGASDRGSVGDAIGNVASGVNAIATGAKSAKENVALMVEEIVVQKDKALAVFGEFGLGTGQILAGIGAIVASVAVPAFVSLAGSMLSALAPLALVGAAGAALYTAWDQNFLGIRDVAETVFSGIAGTIGTFVDNFTTAREAGFSFLDSISIGLSAAGGTFSNVLPGMGEAVSAFAGRALELVGNLALRFGAYLGDLAQRAGAWILDSLPSLGTNLGLFTGKFLGWGVTFVADMLVWAGRAALTMYEWIQTEVEPNLPIYLARVGEGFYNFMQGLIEGLTPYVADLGLRFLTWVDDAVLPYLADQLYKIYIGIRDWIVGSLVSIGSEAQKIGNSIVTGIQAGISAAWGKFTAWVQSKINELPQAVRDALGIGSPSRVMAEEVGRWIPDGIAMGIEQYGFVVGRSIENLFEIGGSIGTFAGKIVERFKREFIEPLQSLLEQTDKEADALGGEISGLDDERANILQALANASNDSERQNAQRRLVELEQRRNELVNKQMTLQKRQTDLQNQAALQQKQLLALEKQRQQFEQFKAQQDLLDSLKEYGLDPRQILGGIDLGGGSDQLLIALQRAQAAILNQLGLNFGGGEIGIGSTGTMSALTSPPGAKATYVTNNGNTNVFNIDARGSNWTEAQFKRVIESTLNSSVQGARTLRVMNA